MDKLQFNLQTWNNDSSPALSAENLNYVNSAINKNLSAINALIDITDVLDKRIDTLTLADINDVSANDPSFVIGTLKNSDLPGDDNLHLLRTLVVARAEFESDYAASFIPLRGEICIIYPGASSIDKQLGIKVGDGSTNWENLPLFKGEKGDKGDTGYSPKISVIGTTTVGCDVGANVNAATSSNGDVDLTFQIPAGPFTELSTDKVYTLDSDRSAYVTLKDVDNHPEQKKLDFGIPRGYKGDKGEAATITIGTVTALPAGSTPKVLNVGTNTAAIFDFEIPQGQGISILGTLTSEAELPIQAEAGSAYIIGGDLYVWSEIDVRWDNVGSIQGPQGEQGPQGDAGISIESVTQTTTSSESGGDNIITCTLSNGNQSTFTIKNGAKGDPGSDATIAWQTF